MQNEIEKLKQEHFAIVHGTAISILNELTDDPHGNGKLLLEIAKRPNCFEISLCLMNEISKKVIRDEVFRNTVEEAVTESVDMANQYLVEVTEFYRDHTDRYTVKNSSLSNSYGYVFLNRFLTILHRKVLAFVTLPIS